MPQFGALSDCLRQQTAGSSTDGVTVAVDEKLIEGNGENRWLDEQPNRTLDGRTIAEEVYKETVPWIAVVPRQLGTVRLQSSNCSEPD